MNIKSGSICTHVQKFLKLVSKNTFFSEFCLLTVKVILFPFFECRLPMLDQCTMNMVMVVGTSLISNSIEHGDGRCGTSCDVIMMMII
jgi:hypothetical protein